MKASAKNNFIYGALFSLSKIVMNITRSEENTFLTSKYVPLDRILEVIRDPLQDAGLMVASSPSFKEGVVTVETRIIHADTGQWVSVSPSAPVVPAKIDRKVEALYITPQGVGAAITYLRRYGLMSLLGLAETDDDGNLASGTPRDERASWTGPLDQLELTKELRGLWGKLEKCQDHEKIDPILWGYSEVIAQCKADLPDRWDGTDGVKGIQTLIDAKREKLAPREEPLTPEALLEEIENRISGLTDLDEFEDIRKEYDEHPGLELPDIRERAQDLFDVKKIEIGTPEDTEEPSSEPVEKPDETPEPEEEDPNLRNGMTRKGMYDHLMRQLGGFTDPDELAAWSDQVAPDIQWIGERVKMSARELDDGISLRLERLKEVAAE